MKKLIKELRLYGFAIIYFIYFFLKKLGICEDIDPDFIFKLSLLVILTSWLSAIWEEAMSVHTYHKTHAECWQKTSFYAEASWKEQLRIKRILEQLAVSRGINIEEPLDTSHTYGRKE